jgi:hypothetical protein
MTRLAVLLVSLAFVAAACGGTTSGQEADDDVQAGATSAPAASEQADKEPGAGSTGSEAPDQAATEEAEASSPAGDTPSGREIIITPDFEDDLNVSSSGWATDFSRHTVRLDEFLSGGPGKDGIPAIDEPTFVSVQDAEAELEGREPIVAVEVDGIVRGYPIRVLIWHEIVNDTIGDVPVSVTFCPLCNTAIAFDRRLGEQLLDFGTTGNLRNSDLVMFDRQTETWWQQFGGEGIIGELAGELLTQVPAAVVAWEDFAAQNPDAEVLSQNTGFSRPYGRNPYVGYDSIDQPPFFPVENLEDNRLPPKERVVLLDRPSGTVAVAFSALAAAGTIEVEVDGELLTVEFVPGVSTALGAESIPDGEDRGSARVTDENGSLVAFDTPFWFAVAAFRPDATIIR